MKAIRNATLISLAVAALALVAVAPVAYADTLIVFGNPIPTNTSVSANMGTISINGFYAAPGYVAGDILTGVEIILSGSGTTQNYFSLGNNVFSPPANGTPGSVTVNSFTNTTTLTLSGLTPPLVLSGTLDTGGHVLTTTAPTTSYYFSDPISILGFSVDDYPSIITPYETAGVISFTLSGDANNGATFSDLSTNFAVGSAGSTLAGASVEAIYTYEAPPSDTPEPGTLTLFGSGLLGLAGMLRRKYMLSR